MCMAILNSLKVKLISRESTHLAASSFSNFLLLPLYCILQPASSLIYLLIHPLSSSSNPILSSMEHTSTGYIYKLVELLHLYFPCPYIGCYSVFVAVAHPLTFFWTSKPHFASKVVWR